MATNAPQGSTLKAGVQKGYSSFDDYKAQNAQTWDGLDKVDQRALAERYFDNKVGNSNDYKNLNPIDKLDYKARFLNAHNLLDKPNPIDVGFKAISDFTSPAAEGATFGLGNYADKFSDSTGIGVSQNKFNQLQAQAALQKGIDPSYLLQPNQISSSLGTFAGALSGGNVLKGLASQLPEKLLLNQAIPTAIQSGVTNFNRAASGVGNAANGAIQTAIDTASTFIPGSRNVLSNAVRQGLGGAAGGALSEYLGSLASGTETNLKRIKDAALQGGVFGAGVGAALPHSTPIRQEAPVKNTREFRGVNTALEQLAERKQAKNLSRQLEGQYQQNIEKRGNAAQRTKQYKSSAQALHDILSNPNIQIPNAQRKILEQYRDQYRKNASGVSQLQERIKKTARDDKTIVKEQARQKRQADLEQKQATRRGLNHQEKIELENLKTKNKISLDNTKTQNKHGLEEQRYSNKKTLDNSKQRNRVAVEQSKQTTNDNKTRNQKERFELQKERDSYRDQRRAEGKTVSRAPSNKKPEAPKKEQLPGNAKTKDLVKNNQVEIPTNKKKVTSKELEANSPQGFSDVKEHPEVKRRPEIAVALNEAIDSQKPVTADYDAEIHGSDTTKELGLRNEVPYRWGKSKQYYSEKKGEWVNYKLVDAPTRDQVYIKTFSNEDGQLRTRKFYDSEQGSKIRSVKVSDNKLKFELAVDRNGNITTRNLETGELVKQEYGKSETIKTSEARAAVKKLQETVDRINSGQKVSVDEIMRASHDIEDADIEDAMGQISEKSRKKIFKKETGDDC